MLTRLFRHGRLGFGYTVTASEQAFYRENGYLILKGLVPEKSVKDLLKRTSDLVESADIIKNQIYFTSQEKF
jgi:hypothetical protein